MKRIFHSFSYKEANFRICSPEKDAIISEITKQRELLGQYIELHPEFRTSLKPLELMEEAPEIARRMHAASTQTGLGPMAAVAGTTAQRVAEAALKRTTEAIVENGGDIYLASEQSIVVGLFAGENSVSRKLAFLIKPEQMPLALCSSSSHMGHSLSLGACDLATVVSKSAALADAAATLACNRVKSAEDIDKTLEDILAIHGILGVLLVKDNRIGLAGELPELIRQDDTSYKGKITIAVDLLPTHLHGLYP